MAKVGSSQELLAENANFVFTGSLWVPMKADASGQLAVGLIADQNAQARSYGYVAGAWQKNPLQLGYSAVSAAEVSDTDAPAGYNVMLSAAVPAGEIWDVRAAHALDVNSATTYVGLFGRIGGVDVYMLSTPTLAASVYYPWNGSMVLAEGDKIGVVFSGVTLHDALYLRFAYIRIDVDL
jgi:hypothetical protein